MTSNPKKLSKKEIQKHIEDIFSNKPSPKEIKKAKRLAMSKNIRLKALKRKFCQKCYTLFNSSNSEIRIKNKNKIIRCKNCRHISRYKIK
jgi:RNase P subunit RPR2